MKISIKKIEYIIVIALVVAVIVIRLFFKSSEKNTCADLNCTTYTDSVDCIRSK